jgi:hypothetical protein
MKLLILIALLFTACAPVEPQVIWTQSALPIKPKQNLRSVSRIMTFKVDTIEGNEIYKTSQIRFNRLTRVRIPRTIELTYGSPADSMLMFVYDGFGCLYYLKDDVLELDPDCPDEFEAREFMLRFPSNIAEESEAELSMEVME